MLVAETILLETVKQGLASIAHSPRDLHDLFETATEQEISKLMIFLSDPTKQVQVILGFPQSEVVVPTVGLTLGSQEESDQYLGQGHQMWLNETVASSPMVEQDLSTVFTSTWRFTVYSPNADLGIKLSYIIKYILLAQRSFLNDAGLLEQRLSMGDFEPTPELLPSFVFVRAVMLSAKLQEVYEQTPPSEPIKNWAVAAQ